MHFKSRIFCNDGDKVSDDGGKHDSEKGIRAQ
jgi:hypothetical protein